MGYPVNAADGDSSQRDARLFVRPFISCSSNSSRRQGRFVVRNTIMGLADAGMPQRRTRPISRRDRVWWCVAAIVTTALNNYLISCVVWVRCCGRRAVLPVQCCGWLTDATGRRPDRNGQGHFQMSRSLQTIGTDARPVASHRHVTRRRVEAIRLVLFCSDCSAGLSEVSPGSWVGSSKLLVCVRSTIHRRQQKNGCDDEKA